MATNSPIPEIAALLVKSEKAYFCNDQLLVKPPGTAEWTAWHRDQGYTLIQGEQVCGVRVPADKETSDMGPVEYLKGSHGSGKIYKVNYFVSDVAAPDDDGEEIPGIEGHERDFDIITFTPEPGDVIVHHLRTLHGAGAIVRRRLDGEQSPFATEVTTLHIDSAGMRNLRNLVR
jgi:ectoine hydroxylase-related dioxygenase (phytanoyl-CoA dioxygenase family)